MTIEQTPHLIKDAQKSLPEAQQIFAQLSETDKPEYMKMDKNRVTSAISKEVEKTKEKEQIVEEKKTDKEAEAVKEEKVESVATVDEKPQETVSVSEDVQSVESKEEIETPQTVVNYKGKTVYPPRVSAAKMRDTHLVSKLKAQHKFVMPGKRRPAAANKRAGKR